MENYIKYFYNIDINSLVVLKDYYLIKSNNNNYIFKKYDDLSFLSYYIFFKEKIKRFNYFFDIIPNRDNDLVSNIDGKYYSLLEINPFFQDDIISIFDINANMYVEDDNSFKLVERFPWISFWEKKIDYFENWILNKKATYKNVYSIFQYYVGISENALLYLKQTINDLDFHFKNFFCIQHNRLFSNTSLYYYYDPTNIVLDHRCRDISEYIKSLWFDGNFDIELFNQYLDRNSFSKNDARIMYSRIMFPTFFFDNIEKYIITKENDILTFLEKKIEDFQIFLMQISKLLRDKYGIESISWINYKN